MAKIEIAAGLVMDAGEAATQTLAPISAKGGGKSYLAGKFVEGLYDAGAPFVVLDPIGNWSALTLAKDGKSPGLAIVVIGGERGDVPLDEEAAEAVGQKLVMDGISAVIDLSELSKTRRKVYVAGLCEAMFRAARKKRTPFMIVFEEAQLFAPQHVNKGEERMLGAVTDIVRLGRNYGLGSMLVTQRPQSVSKEVLNQVECLFVGQLRGPQERKAIAGWVTEQAVGDSVDMKSLPALKVGEFFCWSPSWLRVFKLVKVLPKRTYDGSSTPVLGLASALPRARTSKDLAPVVTAIAALSAVEEVEDESPRGIREALGSLDGGSGGVELQELRGRCSDLEHENRSLWQRMTEGEKALGVVGDALSAMETAVEAVTTAIEAARDVFGGQGVPTLSGEDLAAERVTCHAVARAVEPASRPSKPNGLEKADAAILSVLAWQKGPVSKRKLALLAGYAVSGGGFGNALSRLRSALCIEGYGDVSITAKGRQVIGKVPAPPRGAADLLAWWTTHPKVDGCMAAILGALSKARRPLHPDALAVASGYKPKTGGFGNGLSRLRTLGLVVGKGKQPVQLAEELRG